MLNGTLTLHDIRDVEAFTAHLIPPTTPPQDREDLHAWLIEETWILSTRYHRGNPTYPPNFSVHATNILRKRITDWKRQRHGRTRWQFKGGRTYERTIPEHIPLTEHRTNTTPSRDPATDSPTDLTRLLRTRSSDEAWSTHTRRTRMPRRAA